MAIVDEQSKVINTFLERQRAQSAIRSLAHIARSADAEREARRIAGSEAQVLAALLDLLDTSDPRLLRAVGLVALYLDDDDVVPALRDVALGDDRSDRARLAALVILEKFLGQQPDDFLYQGLQSPETAIAQSLVEMVDHAVHDRDILREYVRAIEQQSEEVIDLVFDITFRLGAGRAVLPLWALAQSKRQDVAELALHRMGSLRSVESGVALQTLLPTLLPAQRELARRSLLKLRLSGIDVPSLPPPPSTWQALVSAVDGQGSQNIWFLFNPQPDAPLRVLSVMINDLVGVWDAVYDREGELLPYLPQERPPGTVHEVALPGSTAALCLLTTTFDLGRRLLRQALALNHAGNQCPPQSYAVMSDFFWKWDDRSLDAPSPIEPPPEAELAALRVRTVELLDHAVFRTWFVQSDTLLGVARQLGWGVLAYGSAQSSQLLDGLVRFHFGAQEIARYHDRLTRMAEWLWLANEKEAARLALVAALTLKQDTPENHPLARRMVELGLMVTLRGLALGFSQQ